MVNMRRANLDAIWAREPSTIESNRREWRRLEQTGEDKFGFPAGVCKSMGPFPLEDTMGMKLACCLLDRSLHPGNNEERIQFSTMRRMRSAYSNAASDAEAGSAGTSSAPMFTTARRTGIAA